MLYLQYSVEGLVPLAVAYRCSEGVIHSGAPWCEVIAIHALVATEVNENALALLILNARSGENAS